MLVYRGSPIYPYKLICCYFLHFDHLELHSVVFLLTGTLAPLHSLSKFYISSRSHVHVFRLVSLHNLPHPLLSALPHRNLHMAGQADPNPLNGAKRRRKIKLLHLTIDSLLGFGQVANCPRPQFPHLSSERCNRWFLNSFPALEPLP